jgi:Resolvase, N terminal domain
MDRKPDALRAAEGRRSQRDVQVVDQDSNPIVFFSILRGQKHDAFVAIGGITVNSALSFSPLPRIARSVSHLLRALETFRALGVEFVSLSEQIDTSTPMGKMVFTILGSVAELERSMIVERVKAGLRNAKVKGKRLGRPRVTVDTAKISSLRASGASWQMITRELGVSAGTAKRAFYSLSKNPSIYPPVSA